MRNRRRVLHCGLNFEAETETCFWRNAEDDEDEGGEEEAREEDVDDVEREAAVHEYGEGHLNR